jgi:hypothetical protein
MSPAIKQEQRFLFIETPEILGINLLQRIAEQTGK